MSLDETLGSCCIDVENFVVIELHKERKGILARTLRDHQYCHELIVLVELYGKS